MRNRYIVFIILFICQICTVCDHQVGQSQKIRTIKAGAYYVKNTRFSGMNDVDFYKTAENPDFSAIVDSAIEKDIHGIHIEGPKIANKEMSDDIPVWGIRQENFYNSYHYRLERLGILIITSMQSDVVGVGNAFQRKGSERPVIPKPECDFRKGYTIDNFVIFPKRQIPELEWYPGDYVIRLIVFDSVSNPMYCTVPEATSHLPPEMGRMGQMDAEKCVYTKSDASPLIPVNDGVSIAVESKNKDFTIYGAYSVSNVVDTIVIKKNVISIGILFTGYENADHLLLTVDIPIDKIDSMNSRLSGYFSFNLSDQTKIRLQSKKIAVYGIYRDLISLPGMLIQD